MSESETGDINGTNETGRKKFIPIKAIDSIVYNATPPPKP